MEGDGPIMGTPRGFGVLAMSSDLVAADATCARVLGFDAAKLPYLETAGQFLGNLDERRIDQRGELPTRDSQLARPCSTSFATGRLAREHGAGDLDNSLTRHMTLVRHLPGDSSLSAPYFPTTYSYQ